MTTIAKNKELLCTHVKTLLIPLIDDHRVLCVNSIIENEKFVFFIKASQRDINKIIRNNGIIFKSIKTFLIVALRTLSVSLIVDVISHENNSSDY